MTTTDRNALATSTGPWPVGDLGEHDVPEQLVGFYIGDFGDQLWPRAAHA
jgi:hypothetical protein